MQDLKIRAKGRMRVFSSRRNGRKAHSYPREVRGAAPIYLM